MSRTDSKMGPIFRESEMAIAVRSAAAALPTMQKITTAISLELERSTLSKK